ncbi:8-oxo-dGTP diphosphatase [Sediminibacillus halophilus]|uniref:8-oxo-dGTP diphosphatase n=1 Tax=Sediminibacillus halophilus TaxID=482461 RepID=A0A1G9R7Q2_9BACI|nr:8-oxo-dGTP diphosphatase [Sediminibacillus halophilus]SDM19254.1 8-oxo-dGTP diphosphatase [Sediminibacillus halophilus]
MRRVTTSILRDDDKLLMLQKPRRGWYAMPGGKMEQGETIKEAAVREYKEETGLTLINPRLGGVFTFIIKEEDKVVDEWMMFTFFSKEYAGEMTEDCREGNLEWVPVDQAIQKPMADGDRFIINHFLTSSEVLYGTFTYTSDYALIDYRLDPPGP